MKFSQLPRCIVTLPESLAQFFASSELCHLNNLPHRDIVRVLRDLPLSPRNKDPKIISQGAHEAFEEGVLFTIVSRNLEQVYLWSCDSGGDIVRQIHATELL